MIFRSPLHNFHLSQGARFKQYGDWEGPSNYTTLEEEYTAIRNNVGLLDISGMTKIKVQGEGAFEFLNKLSPSNLFSLSEGKSIYTAFCRDDGTIIAVYVSILKDENGYWVMTDPIVRSLVWEWLNEHKNDNVELKDLSQEYGCISVIGPKAIEIPKIIIGEDILGLSYLGFEHDKIEEVDCLLWRAGLTGEYEYRIISATNSLEKIWNKIIACGMDYKLTLCGLDVLDIVMLEMKSVNQQDITKNTTLLQLGLHWMINFQKEYFVGKEAMLRELSEGVRCKLIMFVAPPDTQIEKNDGVFIENEKIGNVVRAMYSPTIQKIIGIAFISAQYAWPGLEFEVVQKDSKRCKIKTISAPAFLSKTVLSARG